MAHFNVEKLSLSSKEREKEEQKKIYRRKTALVLTYHYLKEYGFLLAAEMLNSEVNFKLEEYAVCDNIHLESIIQDFESYYFLKYQKSPQIIKKSPEGEQILPVLSKPKNNRFRKSAKVDLNKNDPGQPERNAEKHAFITSKSIDLSEDHSNGINRDLQNTIIELPKFFNGLNNEWKSMAELILQDMNQSFSVVHWEDVIGHERAKELLKEAILYPVKYGELYSTHITPWKSILLYGPSGTGKTLLASAAASESGARFFNLSASTFVSKWRGESEKLLKVLFDLAKHCAPSIIFIDEIDSLLSHRGDDHEASRRMKTELFLQIDSLFSSDKMVLLLSATNMPWQLDYAVLRRLEKRVLVSQPSEQDRKLLFEKFLPSSLKTIQNLSLELDLDYSELAKMTENYSAADIESVCKEVKMNYVRQAVTALESRTKDQKHKLVLKALNQEDVLYAVSKIRPTASEFCSKFEEWQLKHGSE